MKSDKRKLVPESLIRTQAYLAKTRKIPSYTKTNKQLRAKAKREMDYGSVA
jgi:hypothetical protein